tara:strand:+ start:1067 stop:1606 length:540 start_codon:yes stop_codon:yes gene_type:complete
MVSQLKVNEIIKQSGSSITIGESGDTIIFPAGTTISGSATNTPAFGVTLSGNQSLADGSLTKVTWDTELWDSDSAFASNKFTVPSGKAGKYFFTTMGYVDGVDDGEHFFLSFYKNGARIFREVGWTSPSADAGMRAMASVTLDLAVSDYIEVYAYQNEGSARNLQSAYSQFSGHRLIGV